MTERKKKKRASEDSLSKAWEGTQTRHGVGNIAIRRPASQELDDGTPEGPNVRFSRGTFELDDFGSHPVGCTSDVFHFALHGAQVERNAKVGELHVAVLRGQDIRGLEIAVHDVALVQVMQPFQNFDDVSGDETFVEFAKRF